MEYNAFLPAISFMGPAIILALVLAALCINFFTLLTLYREKTSLSSIRQSYRPFLTLFFSQLLENTTWTCLTIGELFWPTYLYSYKFTICLTYLGQIFIVIQYKAIAYLIQTLTNKNNQTNISQQFGTITTHIFIVYLFYSAISHQFFFHQNFLAISTKTNHFFESFVIYLTLFTMLNLIVIPKIYEMLRTTQMSTLAKMVQRQLKIILHSLIIPFLLGKFIIGSSFIWYQNYPILHCIASISTFILATIFYYALNKILQLYPSPYSPHFYFVNEKERTIKNFQTALEGLANAQSIESVYETTFLFFKDEFAISPRALSIQIATLHTKADTIISRFLTLTAAESTDRQKKILVIDELSFDLFYEENYSNHMLFNFLHDIEGDVFVPIYYQEKMIGYLKIALGSRQHYYYAFTEQNSMLTFASYLGSIINVFYNNSIDLFLQQEKKIKNKLYLKHQEIILYQEGIKSSLQNKNRKSPGVILYKKGKFNCFNYEAKQLITFSITPHGNHPIARACLFIVDQIMQKKLLVSCLVEDETGKTLSIHGTACNDQQAVILTIAPANISDTFDHSHQYLNTDTDILYLLYFEKTIIGKQVNSVLPGIGPTLLPTKITLLKTILGKNSFFLDSHHADIPLVVKLIRQANPAIPFHTIEPEDLNSIHRSNNKQPKITLAHIHTFLLKKFNSASIFFIKNIHLVHPFIQEGITDFVKYGPAGSPDNNAQTTTYFRLLFSGKKSLMAMHQENLIHESLFTQLKDDIFALPTPTMLTQAEIHALIDGFTYHINQSYKEFITLTHLEKTQIYQQLPQSFREFYQIVTQIIKRKLKSKQIIESYQLVEQTYDETTAPYLDKHALKESNTLIMLWKQFKSYRKIATFLGVNPSSVQRRCKKLGIIPSLATKESSGK